MNYRSEQGSVNILVLPLVLVSLALIAVAAFAFWAYQGKQDYKNNVDQKVAVAVLKAKQQQSTDDSKKFAEAEKQPLRTYKGPEAFGSLSISYPKTWSAYVDDSGTGSNSTAVDAYFQPGTVPSISDQNSTFALRVQVLSQSYSQVLTTYNSQSQSRKGSNKINPYSLPKLPSVVGVRVDGQISEKKSGSMVILPLRDKTLEIWTESNDYLNDFNNNILPNLTFIP